MPSIFKNKFIYHPVFHDGIVLSDIKPRIDTYVDVFFFETETVKQFKKSFLEEKCIPVTKIKLNDILTESFIEVMFDPSTISKGQKYVSESRINIKFQNDYKVEANVTGTTTYQVNIESNNGRLSYSCSCPVMDDECKHIYALMKYIGTKLEGKEIIELTPFEETLNQLMNAKEKDYFDLGFEACILFLERSETSTQTLARYLKMIDYYSNRAFVPLVLNEGIDRSVSEYGDYETKTRYQKIRQRYIKALDRRNYSFEDVLLAHIFTKQFENIFTYNFEHSYLSSLSREALIYAALHIEITQKIASTLSKLSLNKEEVKKLYNHASNKGAKKYFYMSYPAYFTDLSEEEVKELEYNCDDIFEMYQTSSSLSQPRIIIGHYQTFINEGKEEYLVAMIMDTLSYPENRRNYFLELYQILEKLSDNSLLLKMEFKGDRATKDTILNRWRGYDDSY